MGGMWRLEDHTADVLLVVEADDWSGLLAEAVHAFGGWTSGGQTETLEPRAKGHVAVSGADPVETWVRWWRELHRLWTVEALMPASGTLTARSDAASSSGTILCVPREALDLDLCEDVKAVTWHGAEAAERDDGSWRGTIVLDV